MTDDNEDDNNNSLQTSTVLDDAEIMVQEYARKVGILENTLEIFRNNFKTLHSKYSALNNAYQPLRAQNEYLQDKMELLNENYMNLNREKKKNFNALRMEENKNRNLEKKIVTLEKSLEMNQNMFQYLSINSIEIYKEMESLEPCKYILLEKSELEQLEANKNTLLVEDHEQKVTNESETCKNIETPILASTEHKEQDEVKVDSSNIISEDTTNDNYILSENSLNTINDSMEDSLSNKPPNENLELKITINEKSQSEPVAQESEKLSSSMNEIDTNKKSNIPDSDKNVDFIEVTSDRTISEVNTAESDEN